MKITDLKGLTVGNRIAVTIRTATKKTTAVTGVLSGIQVLDSGSVGVTIEGLAQWIWLESNMTVTWGENIGL
jgi:hypothetical protein